MRLISCIARPVHRGICRTTRQPFHSYLLTTRISSPRAPCSSHVVVAPATSASYSTLTVIPSTKCSLHSRNPPFLSPFATTRRSLSQSDPFDSKEFDERPPTPKEMEEMERMFGEKGAKAREPKPEDPNVNPALIPKITLIAKEQQGRPIPFVDMDKKENNKLPALPLWTATFKNGHELTIGVTADTPISLCLDTGEEMVQVDAEDPLMDELFPEARKALQELYLPATPEQENMNKLANEEGMGIDLVRTPHTLTFTGEALIKDEEDDKLAQEDHGLGMGPDEGFDQQSVKVLTGFIYKGDTYLLAKHLEPMFVVGRYDKYKTPTRRILLGPEETARVLPLIEQANMLDSTEHLDIVDMEQEIQELLEKSRTVKHGMGEEPPGGWPEPDEADIPPDEGDFLPPDDEEADVNK